MEEEWISEEGEEVWHGQEQVVYADTFADRERAQLGGVSFETVEGKAIGNVIAFTSSISLKESISKGVWNTIKSWANYHHYNPKAMVYAALYIQTVKSRELNADLYKNFIAKLPTFAEAKSPIKSMLGTEITHADVIRYIRFFYIEQGRRGIESHPF